MSYNRKRWTGFQTYKLFHRSETETQTLKAKYSLGTIIHSLRTIRPSLKEKAVWYPRSRGIAGDGHGERRDSYCSMEGTCAADDLPIPQRASPWNTTWGKTQETWPCLLVCVVGYGSHRHSNLQGIQREQIKRKLLKKKKVLKVVADVTELLALSNSVSLKCIVR